MRFIIVLVAAVVAHATPPTGFAIHNLTSLKFSPTKVLGARYIARADSARMTVMCAECTGAPAIDVLRSRQTEGTEERVRAGTTTIARLDSMCRVRDPACRVVGLSVPPAVGWMSSYRFGAQFANTVIVLRGGDLLTIRSLASDSSVARGNADRLIAKLVPAIVGR
jgi:hypothetical protein